MGYTLTNVSIVWLAQGKRIQDISTKYASSLNVYRAFTNEERSAEIYTYL